MRFLTCLKICAAFFFFLFVFNSANGQSLTATDTVKYHKIRKVPVVLNDTLFHVYSWLGMYTPEQRARDIVEKVESLEEHGEFNPDSLYMEDTHAGINIFYGSRIIQCVTPIDAIAEKKEIRALAQEHMFILKKTIQSDIYEQSPEMIAKEVGLALGATVVLLILIFLVNLMYKKFVLTRLKRLVSILKGVKIGKYDILSASMEKKLALSIMEFFKLIVILTLVYVFLLVIFYIFPWTKSLSFQLFDFMASPLKKLGKAIVDFLPDLLTISIIYWVTKRIVKFFHFFFLEIGRGKLKIPGFYKDWAMPTYSIFRFFLYTVMFIIILPYLPFADSPAFHGVSVFLGIMFSFGSSSSISNIISGLVITYMRPFQLGDRVKIDSIVGDIVNKNLLVTRIRTIKNEDIAVPNGILLNSHTINYSTLAKEKGLILHTSVTIGYDTPWKTVHELLLRAADRTENTLKDPAPFVLQTALNDFYVEYQINVYTNDANNMHNTEAELHKQIQESFFESGVEIMSPHYYAVRDGNTVSIPEAQRPKGYEPGFFRIFNPHKK